MMNNDNKDIKFTGDPVAFDGAEGKRDPKTGKGRFDLIPEEVYGIIFDKIDSLKKRPEQNVVYDPETIYYNIAHEHWPLAIIQMTIYGYYNRNAKDTLDCPPDEIESCFWKMLQDLAIHFQKGAEHYGERNCQKGIPLWSFKDSAMRHAAQVFEGKKDEPHIISAIWNCWMAEWTVLHEKTKEKIGPYTVKALKTRTPEEIESAKSAEVAGHWRSSMEEQLPELKEFLEAGFVVMKPTWAVDTDELIKSVSELLKKKRQALKTSMYKYPTWSPEYGVFDQEQKRLKRIIDAAVSDDAEEPGTAMVAKDKLEDMKPIIEELKNIAEEYNTPIITAQQKYYTIEEVEAIKKEVAERVGNEHLGRWLADRSNLPYIFKMISTIDLFNELINRIKNIDGPTLYMPEYRKLLTIILNDAMLKYASSNDDESKE